MFVFGATLAGKIALVLVAWLMGGWALAYGLGLSTEQQKRDRRGATPIRRAVLLLPRSVTRAFYILLGLFLLALPVLALLGVTAWG